jgi:hypothetical protein
MLPHTQVLGLLTCNSLVGTVVALCYKSIYSFMRIQAGFGRMKAYELMLECTQPSFNEGITNWRKPSGKISLYL